MCLLYRTTGKEGIFVRYFCDRQIARNNGSILNGVDDDFSTPFSIDPKIQKKKMDAACSIQTDIHGIMLIFICVKNSGYAHVFMRNFLQNSLAVFYFIQHLGIKRLFFEHCDLICVRSKRILLVFSDVRRFHNFGNVFQLRMMCNII